MTGNVVYLAHPYPPFALIREIRTAHNVDRIKSLRQPGRMTFQLSSAESEAFYSEGFFSGMENGSPIAADTIREGSALVDFSTEGIPPYLWYIRRIDFDVQTGEVTVDASEWRQLLYDRQLPLNTPSTSGAAPASAAMLLEQANATNPTFVVGQQPRALVYVLTGQAFQIGGMMVGRAFDEMAKRTDSEWWLEYGGGARGWYSSIQRLRPILAWGYRRGGDRRNEVQLTEGVHLAGVSYARDAREVPRVMRFIQGGGVTPADAPAGAVATKKSGASKSRGRDPGIFTDDSEPRPKKSGGRRGTIGVKKLPGNRDSWGPGLEVETLRVLPQGADDQSMATAAFHGAELPVVALQTVELVIRNPRPVIDVSGSDFLDPSPLWSRFFLGDIITVQLDTPRFYAGVELEVRVIAMQPDEDAGELVVVGEVQ